MFTGFFKKTSQRVYLDHAAATPLHPDVYAHMVPWLQHTGNPSAIHGEGAKARQAIERARTELAESLHVRPDEVTYTSGGTEGNNLALVGVCRAHIAAGRAGDQLAVLTLPTEHPSVLRTVEFLATQGIDVRYVEVTEEGCINEESLRKLLDEKVALVSFAYANSEIGTVQNVKHIVRVIAKHTARFPQQPFVHLDASQAPLWLPCQLDTLGVDLMTLDGGKCGGPVGSGVLIHRRRVPLVSIVQGGGQESGLRSGTEHTASIVGASRAIVSAQAVWRSRSAVVAALRDRFIDTLLTAVPDAVLNGSRTNRIANNINISLPGFDSEFAVVVLDRHGVAASTKSACSGAGVSSSYVVEALTSDPERANSTIRFTLGPSTTWRECARAIDILKEHVAKMRQYTQGV